MQSYKVLIYLSERQDKRNPFILAVVMSDGDGGWRRILKHRGICSWPVAGREMTIGEIIRMQRSWRLRYYRYKDWYGLIEDEWAITFNLEWCLQLVKISKLEINLEAIVKFKISSFTK